MGKAEKLLYTCPQGLRSKTTPQAQLYNLDMWTVQDVNYLKRAVKKSDLELDVVMCVRSTQETKSQRMGLGI